MDGIINGGCAVGKDGFDVGDVFLLSIKDGLIVGKGGSNSVNDGLVLCGGFAELLDGFVDGVVMDDGFGHGSIL